MKKDSVQLIVYGADQVCASCVNSPGSKETYEWLQAAISRKYGEEGIHYKYIDIYSNPKNEEHQHYIQQLLDDELFYPLVVLDGEIVGEGNPRLKTIYQALDEKGFQPVS
ncbi:putative disulfide oxidoreductase YuzD [Thalassobacillus devorans]|uniref:Disulfide oxidoreductase YuzD n=1 Tax=Thalassobacillus devorans TaxID=279813 RepID=A0ABQ1NR92_9BACI|nr:YuzD family protein [Thalassobacillus devorans]NIK29062.1 disulfide oxidoreductase YuzD [Thalassobacillus devorans]GGC81446.1 putative disulfide oxidoreductase YuzD [Thalassobacillus devorans]